MAKRDTIANSPLDYEDRLNLSFLLRGQIYIYGPVDEYAAALFLKEMSFLKSRRKKNVVVNISCAGGFVYPGIAV